MGTFVRRRWWRLALVAVLVFAFTSSSDLFWQPERAAAYTFPTYAKTKTITVQTSMWPFPFWEVTQTAEIKVTYRKDFPFSGIPVKMTINWIHCTSNSALIGMDVTWCGATKKSDISYDFGYNLKKSLPVGSQTCWVRMVVTADNDDGGGMFNRGAQRGECPW